MNRLVIILFFLTVLSSCKDDHFSFLSKTKRLTNVEWQITSMINTQTNELMEHSSAIYNFCEDGSLTIKELNYNTQDTTTWSFMYDEEYIQIGTNTYKVKTLTQKILSLQYGTLDIFYEPYEE